MRRKSPGANTRKNRLKSLFSRRQSSSESDWLYCDEDEPVTRVNPRKRYQRRALLTKLTAIACLLVSLPLLGKWAYAQIFFESDEFILKHLLVQSDGNLDESKLIEIANVSPGMNLMKLDLDRIQNQICALPQVEATEVTRELPDRLRIAVEERIPVAWLASPAQGIRPYDLDRGFLMDKDGFLFRCLSLNDGLTSLPSIESFETAEPKDGGEIESSAVRAALKFIVASDARFLSQGLTIREVRIREGWAMDCEYSTGLVATYRVDDFSRGIDDLALILDQMKEAGKVLMSANLLAEKNIPVTFDESLPSTGIAMKSQQATSPTHVKSVLPDEQVRSVAYQEAAATELSAEEKHLRSILKGG